MDLDLTTIPDHVGYSASSDGRIFNTSGPMPFELKQFRWGRYLGVSIAGRNRQVHRLVLFAFRGDAESNNVCRHLDGNPFNNCIENLAWGTYSENQMDRVRHGTSNRGSRQGQSKLTEAQVVEIRRLAAMGEPMSHIAGKFGLSKSNVHQIVARMTWSWLQ